MQIYVNLELQVAPMNVHHFRIVEVRCCKAKLLGRTKSFSTSVLQVCFLPEVTSSMTSFVWLQITKQMSVLGFMFAIIIKTFLPTILLCKVLAQAHLLFLCPLNLTSVMSSCVKFADCNLWMFGGDKDQWCTQLYFKAFEMEDEYWKGKHCKTTVMESHIFHAITK